MIPIGLVREDNSCLLIGFLGNCGGLRLAGFVLGGVGIAVTGCSFGGSGLCWWIGLDFVANYYWASTCWASAYWASAGKQYLFGTLLTVLQVVQPLQLSCLPLSSYPRFVLSVYSIPAPLSSLI